MSTSAKIQATVCHTSITAPDGGLRHLAAAVLAGADDEDGAIDTALQLARQVQRRHIHRKTALRIQTEQLRSQLAQLERQLAG